MRSCQPSTRRNQQTIGRRLRQRAFVVVDGTLHLQQQRVFEGFPGRIVEIARNAGDAPRQEQFVAARNVDDAGRGREPQQRDRMFRRRIDPVHEVAQREFGDVHADRREARLASRAARRLDALPGGRDDEHHRRAPARCPFGKRKYVDHRIDRRKFEVFLDSPARRVAQFVIRHIGPFDQHQLIGIGAQPARSSRGRAEPAHQIGQNRAGRGRTAIGSAAQPIRSPPGSATASATVDADRYSPAQGRGRRARKGRSRTRNPLLRSMPFLSV